MTLEKQGTLHTKHLRLFDAGFLSPKKITPEAYAVRCTYKRRQKRLDKVVLKDR